MATNSPALPRTRPGRRPLRPQMRIIQRALPFLLIVAAWWLSTSGLHLLPAYKLPRPEVVVETIVEMYTCGVLLQAVGSSLLRLVVGFAVGTGLGLVLAVLVGTNRYGAAFFRPLATFFQAVAGPTWIPLAVLWFGLSTTSVAFIVFNTVFFIVFYNTLMGVETINRNLINSVRTLGGSQVDLIREVLVPGAMPSIVNGLHVGVAYGWRALIAGEIIATGQGLGVLVWDGQKYFRVSDIVVGLLLIGLISLAMDSTLVRLLEARTIERWGLVRNVQS